MPKFIVKDGAQPGLEVPMRGAQLVFGRTEECDVMVNDANVSRRHAQAVLLNGLTALVDLNSSNGTYVNSVPISRSFLMDGDEIRLGSTTIVFIDDQEVPRDGIETVQRSPLVTAGLTRSDSGPRPADVDSLSHTQIFAPLSEELQADALKEIYLKLKTLYRVFHEVAQAASLKDIFEAIGRAATISTSAERVIFFLNAEKTGKPWQRYFTHSASRLDQKLADSAENNHVLERVRVDQAMVLAVVDETGVKFGEAEPNVIAIPLLKGGKNAALIYVDNPDSRTSFSKNDIDFISTLGVQVGIRLNQFEQVQQLKQENVQLRHRVDDDFTIVVQNDRMKQIMQVTERVADTDATVMVTGESGTGKELIARSIHRFSRRGQKPLVAVNCAALPETLLESELFGHEKGAFTGAHERRVGKFELADGGTLFLDEIGDISAAAQAKLLRALQEGEIQRVGGNKTIKVNVRMIAATNKNLAEEVKKGNFRQDLFFRLKVIEINLPALRERKDDVPALAEYFLKQLRQKMPTSAKRFAPETIEALVNYSYPGNIRELRNIIERALVFSFGEDILPENLPMEVFQESVCPSEPASLINDMPTGIPLPLSEVEKRHIQNVMRYSKGNKLKAANLLGISRTTLYEKLKTYDLTTDSNE